MNTLFASLGGEPALTAAVDRFYGRVLRDPRLAPFFAGVDLDRLRRKQVLFLTLATDGPGAGAVPPLGAVHRAAVKQGLGDREVDAALEHLDEVLSELGVAPELRFEVARRVEGTRSEVLGRTGICAPELVPAHP
jgi:hemoglobin